MSEVNTMQDTLYKKQNEYMDEREKIFALNKKIKYILQIY